MRPKLLSTCCSHRNRHGVSTTAPTTKCGTSNPITYPPTSPCSQSHHSPSCDLGYHINTSNSPHNVLSNPFATQSSSSTSLSLFPRSTRPCCETSRVNSSSPKRSIQNEEFDTPLKNVSSSMSVRLSSPSMAIHIKRIDPCGLKSHWSTTEMSELVSQR